MKTTLMFKGRVSNRFSLKTNCVKKDLGVGVFIRLVCICIGKMKDECFSLARQKYAKGGAIEN